MLDVDMLPDGGLLGLTAIRCSISGGHFEKY
jgi:hypothetical protein